MQVEKRTIIKRALIAVAAIPLVLILALMLIDWNHFKGPVQRMASAKLGRPVTIGGAFDVHPSGPLWGRGEPSTDGRARRHESDAAEEFKDVAGLLADENLDQERRSLRSSVRELSVEADAGTITLSFLLGRGQFATAVLREICELGSSLPLDADDD